MTYTFVVAHLKMPAMTAPLSHGKQREEAHLSCSPRHSSTRPSALVFTMCDEGGRLGGPLESSKEGNHA